MSGDNDIHMPYMQGNQQRFEGAQVQQLINSRINANDRNPRSHARKLRLHSFFCHLIGAGAYIGNRTIAWISRQGF